MALYQINLDDALLHVFFWAAFLNRLPTMSCKLRSQTASSRSLREDGATQGYHNETYPHTLTTRVDRMTLGFSEFMADSFRQLSSFAITVANRPWNWLSWRWLPRVSLRGRWRKSRRSFVGLSSLSPPSPCSANALTPSYRPGVSGRLKNTVIRF